MKDDSFIDEGDFDEGDFDDDEYGFEPAVSVTGADEPTDTDSVPARRITGRRIARSGRRGDQKPTRTTLRRRIGATAVLIGALSSMGGAYAAFATSSGAADSTNSENAIAAGRQLYQTSCVTCHGANLEGVTGNGPALIGVGSAAVYFQVDTGRMPLAQQGAYAVPKVNKYSEAETNQLGAYIESVGGGPSLPAGHLRSDSRTLGSGGDLFRLNCASCHGATGKGAPLSAGKLAPSLNNATDRQFWAAMLSGPESMPVFSDNEITPAQKRSIIGYIQTLKASQDPGGNGIDRIGPVSEAIVIWVGGVGALMVAILWIGARVR